MEGPKLGEIIVISPGHPLPAQKEHGEIEDVKSDKHNPPCDFCCFSVIQPAEHLGEPVMEGCKKTESHAAEDDVVKMGRDPISIVEVHIGRQGSLDQARQPTNRKEKNEGETKKERWFN